MTWLLLCDLAGLLLNGKRRNGPRTKNSREMFCEMAGSHFSGGPKWPKSGRANSRTAKFDQKRWGQTGSRQSTPLSTIRTRYGNSVSTLEATWTCITQQNSLRKGSAYGMSVSTPHRRYGHDCGRRFCGHRFRDFYEYPCLSKGLPC